MLDSTRESHELHKEPRGHTEASSADVGSEEASSQTGRKHGNKYSTCSSDRPHRSHFLPRRVLPCTRTGLGRGRQNTQFSMIQGSPNIYSKKTEF